MNKLLIVLSFGLVMLCSCGEYVAVQKSADYDYRYEFAKASFVEGKYAQASAMLGDVLAIMKGTSNAEESLYLLAQSEFCDRNYDIATTYFKKYYQTYPKGIYTQQARYYSAYSLYMQTPEARLDQSATLDAIREFQNFMDYYPDSELKPRAQQMVMELQDKLVEKEYLAAKLYYDLGTYMINCAYGGSNYEAAVVTAQNALKEYPYASPDRREELSILVLRSKYQLAKESVPDKRIQRFRDAIDEYYSFVNDYPESKYLDEAKSIFKHAEDIVKRKKINLEEED